jgi:hypothetical protein
MTRDLEWHENKTLRRMEVAAPEMLAVLQDVAEHFEGTDSPLGERARAVIRKATGGNNV